MQSNLPIVGYRRVSYGVSSILVLLSLATFVVPGWSLRQGIDFTGGSLMEISFSGPRPTSGDVVAALGEEFGSVEVTPVGEQGYVLRLSTLSEEAHQNALEKLTASFPAESESGSVGVSEERFTSIGPTIGAELRQRAVWAIAAVLIAIVLYIAWAFRHVSHPVPSWQYGSAAIVALFHDVTITVGVFALLGRFAHVEVGTLFITALLTVLGFSVHDTIVVFDRIREKLKSSSERFPAVVNMSLNETMARSINTSLTTVIVLGATIVFGGESIRYFAVALTIGIIVGTYSSIFIAAPLLVSWFRWKEGQAS